jgi:hypothetical protein
MVTLSLSFDEYFNSSLTKDYEHRQRASNISFVRIEVIIEVLKFIRFEQHVFLPAMLMNSCL